MKSISKDSRLWRYRLAGDLQDRGFTCLNLPLEIGCRGVINARNHLVLETLFNMFKIRARKRPIPSLGRIALLGSKRIWLARQSQEWSGGDLIRWRIFLKADYDDVLFLVLLYCMFSHRDYLFSLARSLGECHHPGNNPTAWASGGLAARESNVYLVVDSVQITASFFVCSCMHQMKEIYFH